MSQTEEYVQQYADDLTNAFYHTAQTLIGQTDGGFASIFESDDHFMSGPAKRILNAILADIGEEAFVEGAPSIWAKTKDAGVVAQYGDPSLIEEDNISALATAVSGSLVSGLMLSFPDTGPHVLDNFTIALRREATKYISYELAMNRDQHSTPSM